MKDLVKFELYKMFTQKTIYLVAALLMIVTLFFLYQMKGPSLHSLYQKWEGPVTAQEIELAKQKDDEIVQKQANPKADISWKELKLRNVYDAVIEVGMYNASQKRKIHHIEQKINNQKNQSNYVHHNLNLKEKMIKDIDYQDMYYNRPATQIIDFVGTYGYVILGALIVVGLSSIFTQEVTTGVNQYMLSSKLGRRTIVLAKIIASIIFIFISLLFLVGIDLVYWILTDGNYGWKAPLQSIQKFWESPYSFDLGSYLWIKVAFQFLAACGFAMFVLLVSALTRNSIISFFISGFVIAFPILVEQFIPFNMDTFYTLLKFTYADMMIVDVLFQEFNTVNLFGYPVLYPIFAIGLLVVSTSLIVYLLYKVMAKKQAA
ncbi:hypothetical protein GCM10009001_35770 [Virgibacillus siamensis]|uniref:ABC-2 type transporter transmembrane domain-containing protein n=1 Tax=Virgibacillus siamensis TaxID=480071 RepID=A0ABN1GNT1_9BACI